MDERFVLVRTRLAGVLTGYLVSRDAGWVVLREARQLWRWRCLGGGATLVEVARYGSHATEHTRLSEPAPGLVEVPAADVAALVDVAPEAAENLRTSRWL
jgi:hypothetical protein